MITEIRKLPGSIVLKTETAEVTIEVRVKPLDVMTRAKAVAMLMETGNQLNAVRFAPEMEGGRVLPFPTPAAHPEAGKEGSAA